MAAVSTIFQADSEYDEAESRAEEHIQVILCLFYSCIYLYIYLSIFL